MKKEDLGFLDFFNNIPNHRVKRSKLYKVQKIMLVTFYDIISGYEG